MPLKYGAYSPRIESGLPSEYLAIERLLANTDYNQNLSLNIDIAPLEMKAFQELRFNII